MGGRVAVEPDVSHVDGRHKMEHAVGHAESGAENRHDGHLFAVYHFCFHRGERRFDRDLLKRKIPGSFIAHEHGYLGDEFAEVLGVGILAAEYRQLVLYQRMGNYMQLIVHVHGVCSLSLFALLIARIRSACEGRR
ncbi:hypothetical protein SDC9_201955 [bioreactor metagenome]|uniref:Uncharacterized protein n=1 Tax=bioreactor metagenome TaxID=1076179 RepID=A0A645ISB3_9ZZZZ